MMMREKKFVSLYEKLTKTPFPTEKFIKKEEKEEVIEEEKEKEEKIEEEISAPEEIPREEIELEFKIPEFKIPEIQLEAEKKPTEEIKEEEITPKPTKIEVEEETEEEIQTQERYEKLVFEEEIISEELTRRKVREKFEDGKKKVEGEEDIKRKVIVGLDVPETKREYISQEEKISETESQLKTDEQKDKITFMDKENINHRIDKEPKSKQPLIQEIIDRIRVDIIARAEVEAKKKIDEAEKKAKEIIDNAYKESEKIINEALSRSLDISREIEKEAEERGFKKGYEKGYKEGENKGYEDAYKKTLSEGRYALEMIRKISDEVAYAKERFSDDFPKIVLHLTLVALKTILMTERIKDEELVIRALKDALDKVKGFKIVRIRLNEKDIEIVKKFFQIPEDIDIVPDNSVQRGDVKIDMREGYFESSIKWREKIIEEVLKGELENLMSEKPEENSNSPKENPPQGNKMQENIEIKESKEIEDIKEVE
jgi:flagellar assembly protein FliH